MTWSDWDKAILALTMWREARGEGKSCVRMREEACPPWLRVGDCSTRSNPEPRFEVRVSDLNGDGSHCASS